jgi:uncharacterized repeat protein (TIGR01451 family)
MSCRPHHGRQARSAIVAALATFAVVAGTAIAAPPAPSSGSANVDGTIAEWNVVNDLFSDMIRAGGNGGQTKVESKLYLRYDCTTHTVFANVRAEPGVTIAADLPGESFIKVGGVKKVDGMTGDDGTAPDFAWVGLSGTAASGWEASFPLGVGSYTINVHAQVNDGGLQTSAVPGRSIPLVLACDVVQPKPLVVTKTAVTSYGRAYDWVVAKSAAPASITTAADQATFTYTVTATKSAPTDANFAVTGEITVANPNATPISGVDIADAIVGGPSCAVQGGIDVTIPAQDALTVPYTCALTAATDGTNGASATWSGGASATEVPFAFGGPTSVTNDTVDVTDAFNGAVPVILAGGQGLTASTVLTYTRTVPVPAAGCTQFPNVAMLNASQEVIAQASAQVEACRTTTNPPAEPPVTPPATPPATPVVTVVGTSATPASQLTVVKRGPATAKSGQVITFTIIVRNESATAATSVVLSDVLPTGYAIAKRPAGAVLQKGTITWSLGDLAPGASTTLKLQVRIDRNASGRRCNRATASAANAATVTTRACTKVVRIAGVTRIPIVTG